jgi:hypothetical protein
MSLSCVLLIASMVLFLVARDSYPGLIAVMAVSGLGVSSCGPSPTPSPAR